MNAVLQTWIEKINPSSTIIHHKFRSRIYNSGQYNT